MPDHASVVTPNSLGACGLRDLHSDVRRSSTRWRRCRRRGEI